MPFQHHWKRIRFRHGLPPFQYITQRAKQSFDGFICLFNCDRDDIFLTLMPVHDRDHEFVTFCKHVNLSLLSRFDISVVHAAVRNSLVCLSCRLLVCVCLCCVDVYVCMRVSVWAGDKDFLFVYHIMNPNSNNENSTSFSFATLFNQLLFLELMSRIRSPFCYIPYMTW